MSTAVISPREAVARTGMLLFLGSWWMTFAALFFCFLLLRADQNVWPAAGTLQLPSGLITASTLATLGSSVLVWRWPERRGLAAALGWLFVVLQGVSLAWAWRSGFRLEASLLGSFAALLVGFHGLHALVGVGGLSYVALARSASRTAAVLWGQFWHFVGLVWAMIYLLVL